MTNTIALTTDQLRERLRPLEEQRQRLIDRYRHLPFANGENWDIADRRAYEAIRAQQEPYWRAIETLDAIERDEARRERASKPPACPWCGYGDYQERTSHSTSVGVIEDCGRCHHRLVLTFADGTRQVDYPKTRRGYIFALQEGLSDVDVNTPAQEKAWRAAQDEWRRG